MSNPTALVQKLWNYCNVLRDDGLSYGDYVEQLTYLLFLEMADEQSRPPFNQQSSIPKGFGWDTLVKLDGDDLEIHYRHTLEELGKRPGMLGTIFRKAWNPSHKWATVRIPRDFAAWLGATTGSVTEEQQRRAAKEPRDAVEHL